MFGVETRAWSLATPASASAVATALREVPEPGRRDWLLPGALAPLVRVRDDAGAPYLRLSPGDPRRGPGSADRAYVRVRPDGTGAVVEVAQRPRRAVQVGLGTVSVAAWSGAALAALHGLASDSLLGLLAVLPVLVLRSVVDLGRRLDERQLRRWLTARLVLVPAPRDAARSAAAGSGFGPPRYDVPAGDCG